MKKIKSLIALILVLATVFCISASAAEWHGKNILYTFDNDTGVMVIRGEGKTVTTHMFGFGYCDYENCLVPHPGEFDDDPPSQTEIAVQNTKTLIIESGVKLADGALSPFDNVETIILPDDMTVIPEGLCAGLKKLKTIVIPYGVTEIEDYAFSDCVSLKNININSNVETIGDYAFDYCDLNYVKIPDTVKNVGEGNKLTPDCLEKVNVEVNRTYVNLTWKGVKDASRYRVFIRENGKWKKVEDIHRNYAYDLDEFEFNSYIGNLKPNTKYTFAVRPFNKIDGKNLWAPKYIKVTVTTTLLEKVQFTSSTPKKGTVKLTWDDIDGEQGYQVWYSTKSDSGFKKYSNYKANTEQATITGLTSGKTYYFRVRAYSKLNGKYTYSTFSNSRPLKIK